MTTLQGRRLGYHTTEQVSNQEPPDSRPCVLTTTLSGGYPGYPWARAIWHGFFCRAYAIWDGFFLELVPIGMGSGWPRGLACALPFGMGKVNIASMTVYKL